MRNRWRGKSDSLGIFEDPGPGYDLVLLDNIKLTLRIIAFQMRSPLGY